MNDLERNTGVLREIMQGTGMDGWEREQMFWGRLCLGGDS